MSTAVQKLLIASKPFIKKTNAREVIGCNHQAICELWNSVCEDYEHEYGPVPSYGIPTTYFLEKAHISRDELALAVETEKKFNAS